MATGIRLAREGVRSLARHRLRSALMALATALGVTALVVIVAFGRGTRQQVLARFEEAFGGTTMFIRGGAAQFGPGQGSGMPNSNLTIADLEAIRAAVATVTEVDPIAYARTTVAVDGASRATTIEGHAPAAERLWGRAAERGSFFGEEDMSSAARVALVGRVVARELFGDADPVGAQLRIGTVPFEVIGVLAPGGVDPHGVDRDDAVWIPITTLQRRVMNTDLVMVAKLGHRDGTDLELATLEVTDVLRARHALAPGTPSDFAIYTPVGVEQRIQQADRTFSTFLPLVTLLGVLVSGLVVTNLMLLAVSERRAEIGLRKALGARERDIRTQFGIEATLVTTAGGMLALALSAATLRAAPLWSMPAMPLPWGVALMGLGVAIALGLLAGIVPARRAAALDPVVALR